MKDPNNQKQITYEKTSRERGRQFHWCHLVKHLKAEGHWVRGVDIKPHEFAPPVADEFIVADLLGQNVAALAVEGIDVVYRLAADIGGAGHTLTGDHDAAVMYNSATINLNTLEYGYRAGVSKFFYSYSACIHPEYNQRDPENSKCSEEYAYTTAHDSKYCPIPIAGSRQRDLQITFSFPRENGRYSGGKKTRVSGELTVVVHSVPPSSTRRHAGHSGGYWKMLGMTISAVVEGSGAA